MGIAQLCVAGGVVLLSGCSYVGTALLQRQLAAEARAEPRQRIYKHLLDRENFFIYGELIHDDERSAQATAVLALSDVPVQGELVDVCHAVRGASYFGLNVPAGEYRLVVVRDLDGDGFYSEREAVAARQVSVGPETARDMVVPKHDIDVSQRSRRLRVVGLNLRTEPARELSTSIFYPRGTIRSLDDPLFSPAMAHLGMYKPAAFLEAAPMLFYSLEEDHGFRIPIVFVHGIDGSARDFSELIARLDRSRYQVWFYHYPSGSDLGRLGQMFYTIFLSGKTIPRSEMPMIIVAHSMGGVVVREALNRYHATPSERLLARVITLASPLGGHPSARLAAQGPVVLPSWRDLNPDGRFMRELFRAPLSPSVEYNLLYAYRALPPEQDPQATDGVVPLQSQLRPDARQSAKRVLGLHTTHMGILRDPESIQTVLGLISEVKSPLPEEHLAWCNRGGYDVPLPEGLDAMERYLLSTLARYMDALVTGRINPAFPEQQQFLDEIQGRKRVEFPASRAWLKFVQKYPDRSGW